MLWVSFRMDPNKHVGLHKSDKTIASKVQTRFLRSLLRHDAADNAFDTLGIVADDDLWSRGCTCDPQKNFESKDELVCLCCKYYSWNKGKLSESIDEHHWTHGKCASWRCRRSPWLRRASASCIQKIISSLRPVKWVAVTQTLAIGLARKRRV